MTLVLNHGNYPSLPGVSGADVAVSAIQNADSHSAIMGPLSICVASVLVFGGDGICFKINISCVPATENSSLRLCLL